MSTCESLLFFKKERKLSLFKIFITNFLYVKKELEASFQEGEMKRQEAINHLDAIRGVLPKAKLGELETKSKSMDKEWQNLIKSLQQAK